MLQEDHKIAGLQREQIQIGQCSIQIRIHLRNSLSEFESETNGYSQILSKIVSLPDDLLNLVNIQLHL